MNENDEPVPTPELASTVEAPDAADGGDAALEAGRPVPAEAADQSELDLGVISTGSANVDEALQPLESVAGLPVGEHPGVFEQVLGDLSATLSATDSTGDSTGGSSGGSETTGSDH